MIRRDGMKKERRERGIRGRERGDYMHSVLEEEEDEEEDVVTRGREEET